jgi:fumarate hydratase, class II
LQQALQRKAKEFHDVLKIGRTHLQDATPIRLGQEFGGYASQVQHGIARLRAAEKNLGELALGGTAVGTGINTHPEFARRTIARLAAEMNLPCARRQTISKPRAARRRGGNFRARSKPSPSA